MEPRTFRDDLDITEENALDRADDVFGIIVQERPKQLDAEECEKLIDEADPVGVLDAESRDEAFDELRDTYDVGQKVANEYLRHMVDVFGINEDKNWRPKLEVALDTHVVRALVKTGGIDIDPSEAEQRDARRIVNMDPDSDPRKLVGYDDVQDAFREAADEHGFNPIAFDELWTEHREFISDPLLRSESAFENMIREPWG